MIDQVEIGTDLQALAGEQVDPTESVTMLNKRESAKLYADYDSSIFPCKPDEKIPAIKGWQKQAISDKEVLMRLWSKTPWDNMGFLAYEHIALGLDVTPYSDVDVIARFDSRPCCGEVDDE